MIMIQNTDTSTDAEWELSLRENEKKILLTFQLVIIKVVFYELTFGAYISN